MAISEQMLKEVFNRASHLMSEEGQRKIEQARKNNSNNYDSEGTYVQSSSSHNMRMNTPVTNTTKNVVPKNNGLPKAILESMSNKPINVSTSEYSCESSVLDAIAPDIITEQKMTPTNTQTYSQPIPQYVPQPQYPSIDYNYIRAIVNECIDNKLKQIKEEILNESSLKVIRVAGENKIQLIDNKNNLYESKLEFKKNLKK